MKVGLVSSCVPLVFGGARNIVDWLHVKLLERGEDSEIVYLPSSDAPEELLEQMAAFRLLRFDDYFDRIITFRPPAHVLQHRNKIVWFIHHIRICYDLWNTPYYRPPTTAPWQSLRRAIMQADTVALREARKVFTNSRIVGERLRQYNGIESEVLYPPLLRPGMFSAGAYGDEIVCVGRMEPHKRQHLLLEAMAYTKTGVRLRLCGSSMNAEYVRGLHSLARTKRLRDRVIIEDRWVDEEEKAARLRDALAAAYVPYDEDSYGYPTIEAAHARRCTVTLNDAGGVLEFVLDGVNGYVVQPEPRAIAEAFDRLHAARTLAQQMGEAAAQRLAQLGIDWARVLAHLLS
jgi:glycosyltransferase involved in cell wall biosynthesis